MGKNKSKEIMRHTENLSLGKSERTGIFFISREEPVSLLSWMISQWRTHFADGYTFSWWQHQAFEVSQVSTNGCCTGPTSACGCNLGSSHPSSEHAANTGAPLTHTWKPLWLHLQWKLGSHASSCHNHPGLCIYQHTVSTNRHWKYSWTIATLVHAGSAMCPSHI